MFFNVSADLKECCLQCRQDKRNLKLHNSASLMEASIGWTTFFLIHHHNFNNQSYSHRWIVFAKHVRLNKQLYLTCCTLASKSTTPCYKIQWHWTFFMFLMSRLIEPFPRGEFKGKKRGQWGAVGHTLVVQPWARNIFRLKITRSARWFNEGWSLKGLGGLRIKSGRRRSILKRS